MRNLKIIKTSDESLAQELYQIIEERKHLEKREKELKQHFKAVMGKNHAVRCGDYAFTLKEAVTTYIDRAALALSMGDKFLEKFTKETQYTKFEIVRIK